MTQFSPNEMLTALVIGVAAGCDISKLPSYPQLLVAMMNVALHLQEDHPLNIQTEGPADAAIVLVAKILNDAVQEQQEGNKA